MVKLNKIYTKTGDNGTTGLVDGTRRIKSDLRIAAYGDVDETNATIGIARLYTKELSLLDAMLMRIQNDLFDLGADLANPLSLQQQNALRIVANQVERLEREIDALNSTLTPLNSFVLPGGSEASSFLHLARTIARRAERGMVALNQKESIGPAALLYINRLSDLLFVASRYANQPQGDVLWEPGKNR